jgi:drug/metabolite transporter (DMT)-like permease
MKETNTEKTGEILILTETIIYALFPIIIAYSTKILPPILFAGLSTFTASITLFSFLLVKGRLKKLMNREMIKYALGITLFIIIIPSILIFMGSSKTSGINTTILLQSEILFTFIIFGLFSIEKITLQKIIGALIVIIGTFFIIYSGNAEVNRGDLMIIAGTLFYPLGNLLSKKALKIAKPSEILFIRSFLGGIILISISLIFEDHNASIDKIKNYWPLIALNGILIYHLSKILWYEGIKRIDISKATPMSLGGYPAFSLLFAMIFLKESPTIHQFIGAGAVVIGVIILTVKIKKSNLKRV